MRPTTRRSLDIRTVETSKHLPTRGFVATQLDATSDKHAVLRGNTSTGFAYLNKDELQQLIYNLEDLLEALGEHVVLRGDKNV